MIIDDLFDTIHTAHVATGHGGRNVLYDNLSKKYANVSQEQIMMFLQLCEECQLKKSKVRKSVVVKPIISTEMNERCQVILLR